MSNRVNTKGDWLKLSHRCRERARRILTMVNSLKHEKEGNNKILGVIIVTDVKTTWISLPSEIMLNQRSRSIENGESSASRTWGMKIRLRPVRSDHWVQNCCMRKVQEQACSALILGIHAEHECIGPQNYRRGGDRGDPGLWWIEILAHR
jgi:hypothetical protein